MMPTQEQYLEALKIVETYQQEQKRLYDIRKEAFKKDLQQYFETNRIDGNYFLKGFILEGSHIIPINPHMDEDYEGGNNEDIENLCKKHEVKFAFPYWCYPK